MMSISGVNAGAARPMTAIERTLEVSRVQKPGETSQSRPQKPVTDEYIPEEKRESYGRYWMGKDGDGQPKIYFDDPERAEKTPEKAEEAPERPEDAHDSEKPGQAKGAKAPAKKEEEEERWVCDTGKVDREIKQAKKKQEELKRQINTEHDESKSKDLKRQLAQAERELSQKDNDTYRRQHSTFTRLA